MLIRWVSAATFNHGPHSTPLNRKTIVNLQRMTPTKFALEQQCPQSCPAATSQSIPRSKQDTADYFFPAGSYSWNPSIQAGWAALVRPSRAEHSCQLCNWVIAQPQVTHFISLCKAFLSSICLTFHYMRKLKTFSCGREWTSFPKPANYTHKQLLTLRKLCAFKMSLWKSEDFHFSVLENLIKEKLVLKGAAYFRWKLLTQFFSKQI